MNDSAQMSVVIRNRNEGKALRQVLMALHHQTKAPAEIILVDNESTDDSRSIGETFGATILHLPRRDFTYGRALNRGIEATRCPIVLILSAHSVPLGEHFIEDLLQPFDDSAVVAVNCRNVAKRDELANWTVPITLSGATDWPPLFQHGLINRAAAIRRDVWTRYHFHEELVCSEDTLWSHRVLEAGHKIVWAKAMYVYTLDRGMRAAVRKRYNEAFANFQLSGILPSRGLGHLLRTLLLRVPKAAARQIVFESLLYASRLAIKRRARRIPSHALAGPVSSADGRSPEQGAHTVGACDSPVPDVESVPTTSAGALPQSPASL